MAGMTLTYLGVEGPGKRPAWVELRRGLNVISGASETGKSYVFQCIDFMLGGSTPPKSVPEADGYTEVYLGIDLPDGRSCTLRRSLSGGELRIYEVAHDQIGSDTPSRILAERHASDDLNTVSTFLLSQIGLLGRQLKKNARGEKASLSFRNLAKLALVSEEEILVRHSPILSSNSILSTSEESAFRVVVTGTDDSALIASEDPKIRKARLHGELDVLDRLIEVRGKQAAALPGDGATIGDQLAKVQRSIEEASGRVSAAEAEMAQQEGIRQSAWESLQPLHTRRRTLAELFARFKLLADYYGMDRSRLVAMMETSARFTELPEVPCPLCGATAQPDLESTKPADLETFRAACESELARIVGLARDLAATTEGLTAEDRALAARVGEMDRIYGAATARIREVLQPKMREGEQSLGQLIRLRDQLARAAALHLEVLELQTMRALTEQALKARRSKAVVTKGVETRDVGRFCRVVEEILRAWKYPDLDRVVFADKKLDIVLTERDRGSLGKGYRAIAHAAFTVGLMRYCLEAGLPHPGFVVLDSPLVTLRERDKSPNEAISDNMKAAFYSTLGAGLGVGQVVILENDDPPVSLHSQIGYTHFSKLVDVGRYGFFDPNKSGQAQAPAVTGNPPPPANG